MPFKSAQELPAGTQSEFINHDETSQKELLAGYLRDTQNLNIPSDASWQEILDYAAAQMVHYGNDRLAMATWQEPTLYALSTVSHKTGIMPSIPEQRIIKNQSKDRVREYGIYSPRQAYTIKQFGRVVSGTDNVEPQSFYMVGAKYPHPQVLNEHTLLTYVVDTQSGNIECIGYDGTKPAATPVIVDILDALREPKAAFDALRPTQYAVPALATRAEFIDGEQYRQLKDVLGHMFGGQSSVQDFIISCENELARLVRGITKEGDLYGIVNRGNSRFDIESVSLNGANRISGFINIRLGVARLTRNGATQAHSHSQTVFGVEAANVLGGVLADILSCAEQDALRRPDIKERQGFLNDMLLRYSEEGRWVRGYRG